MLGAETLDGITIADITNTTEGDAYDEIWEGYFNLKAQDYTIVVSSNGATCVGLDIDANGDISSIEKSSSLITELAGIDNLHEISSAVVSGSGIGGEGSSTGGGLTGQLVADPGDVGSCLDNKYSIDDSNNAWKAAQSAWQTNYQADDGGKGYGRVYITKLKLGTTAARKMRVRYFNNDLTATPRFLALITQDGKFIAYVKNTNEGYKYAYIVETLNSIDYNWASKSPLKDVINNNNFQVDFKGTFEFKNNSHLFVASADDTFSFTMTEKELFSENVQFPLSGEVMLQGGSEPDSETLEVPAGKYDLELNYTEKSGGAAVKLDWLGVNESNMEVTFYNKKGKLIEAESGSKPIDAIKGVITNEKIIQSVYKKAFRIFGGQQGDYDFFLNVGENGNLQVLDNGKAIQGLSTVSSTRKDFGHGVKATHYLKEGWHIFTMSGEQQSAHPDLIIAPKENNYFTWTVYASEENLLSDSQAWYIHKLKTVSDDETLTELDFEVRPDNKIKEVIEHSAIPRRSGFLAPSDENPVFYDHNGDGTQETAMSWEGDFEFEDAMYVFYFSAANAEHVKVSIDGIPFVSSGHSIGRQENSRDGYVNAAFMKTMSSHHTARIRVEYSAQVSNNNKYDHGKVFLDWKRAEGGQYYPLHDGLNSPITHSNIKQLVPTASRSSTDPTVDLRLEPLAGSTDVNDLTVYWTGAFNFA
ncbi:hypothetical protein, partial [Candidatus Venteria ishoeyi]